MRYLTVCTLLTLAFFMLIAEASARVRIRVRTTRYRSSSGGSSKPKITKTTPIKATKFSSPVIKSQAKLGSRTQLFTKFAAGYLFTRYLLSVAPVYRGGFPVYGSYVSIPEKRAVRLTSETVSLLDSNGRLCLGQSSRTRSLKEGIENSLIEVRTTVKYQGTKDEKTFTGIKNTVPLNDVKGKTFTVTSRARYRIPVVENTQCRQVEKKVSGTMIQLYEHNPNAAGLISIDLKLIFASIMVIGVFNGFK